MLIPSVSAWKARLQCEKLKDEIYRAQEPNRKKQQAEVKLVAILFHIPHRVCILLHCCLWQLVHNQLQRHKQAMRLLLLVSSLRESACEAAASTHIAFFQYRQNYQEHCRRFALFGHNTNPACG